MSRNYNMQVTVSDYSADKQKDIITAAEKEWDFGEWDIGTWSDTADGALATYMVADGDGNLCGGELEEVFVKRLTEAIWKANEAFCKIDIVATDLENIPFERYELDENDYEKWNENNT